MRETGRSEDRILQSEYRHLQLREARQRLRRMCEYARQLRFREHAAPDARPIQISTAQKHPDPKLLPWLPYSHQCRFPTLPSLQISSHVLQQSADTSKIDLQQKALLRHHPFRRAPQEWRFANHPCLLAIVKAARRLGHREAVL